MQSKEKPADEIVFLPSEIIQVYLDDRELRSETAKKLFELGAKLKAKRLVVGDFILSDRVGLEKKLAADFENSIIDGRLFVQAQELVRNFSCPILVVVGREFERINPRALKGAFISLAIDFKIPLFFFDSEEELAEFIFQTAEREQLKEKKELKLRLEKRIFDLPMHQQFIVESLPLVGPVHAKKLLEYFGSVERVFNASEEELKEVDGIGEIKAKEIRRVVSARYEKPDEEECD
ncbi:hypothetical protein HY991_02675 [Candidatus Micrarchaeota archaeon]|nr:hypothetical protein [Candidatus Micrarchaeota archaeon]